MESSENKAFDCQCEERFRAACEGLGLYGEADGKRYCVLHFPGEEKETDGCFQKAIEKKLESLDFDFSGVYFTSADFRRFDFEGSASFIGAAFSAVADFSGPHSRRGRTSPM